MIPRGAELVLEILHVRVPEYGRIAVGDRLGEPYRVDDRCVVQLIGNDDVVLAEQRRTEALVRVPAADVGEGGAAADEAGERRLELPVDRERPANEPDRSRAGAELVQGLLSGGDH